MMNSIGKSLVIIHTALSLLALACAAAMFLQFVDWGWKQPRLDVSERVPSELDKRIAAVNEAKRASDLVTPSLKKAQDDLLAAMDRYGDNHLFYRDELQRLEKHADDKTPIVVKEVKVENNVVKLDAPRIGVPVLEQKVDGIDKSLKQYEALLYGQNALYKQLKDVEGELRDLTAKAALITAQLNGLDDKGNKTKVGLYDLLEEEAQMQSRIRFEKAYIQPQWADAIKDAQDFSERRERLQQALDRLKQDLEASKKK